MRPFSTNWVLCYRPVAGMVRYPGMSCIFPHRLRPQKFPLWVPRFSFPYHSRLCCRRRLVSKLSFDSTLVFDGVCQRSLLPMNPCPAGTFLFLLACLPQVLHTFLSLFFEMTPLPHYPTWISSPCASWVAALDILYPHSPSWTPCSNSQNPRSSSIGVLFLAISK